MENENREELLQQEEMTSEETMTENTEDVAKESIEETAEQPINYTRVGQKKQEVPRRKLVGVDDPKVETKRILIFLVVAFGICWIMEFTTLIPMYRSGNVDLVTQAMEMIDSLMFAPAMGAIIARILTSEGLTHSGFQFNVGQHKFCFGFGWLGMTALTFLGAIIYFVLFKDNFDPNMTDFVESSIANGSTMDAVNIVATFKTNLLMNVFTAPLMDVINCFGMEWGFRAYLLPKLYRKFGTVPAMLLSGLAYGLWFAPLVSIGYFYGEGYNGFPVTGILAMCVFGLVTGCIYAFLALRSGSVFPSILASSALNVMMSQAALFTKDGGNFFVGPAPTGIVAGIPMIIMAVICVIYLCKNPVKPSSERKAEESQQRA